VARRLFFVDRVDGDRAVLTGDEARHLARVLRAETGERYEISDNHRAYVAEISEATPARVVFRILEALPTSDPPAHITLFAALIKFDRFEWIVEKATELGATQIVPVNAARSEKGLASAAQKRIERWRKIAREASRQSRRLRLPELMPPVPFSKAVVHQSPYRYFLEEQPGAVPLLRALPTHPDRLASDTVALLVGPEGGWTDAERALASSSGWQPVSLAANILRAETAALAALALISTAWAS
jgi:16S rRNA (uracil1498-N3)-methyltransferase